MTDWRSIETDPPPRVLDEVAAERERQIKVEHWTAEHDDAHKHGEMAGAAALYALNTCVIKNDDARMIQGHAIASLWPWASHWWKPKDSRRDLIRAAALIVAEIERLDRASQPLPPPPGDR